MGKITIAAGLLLIALLAATPVTAKSTADVSPHAPAVVEVAFVAKDTAEPAVVLMTFRFITGAVKTYRVSPRKDVQPLDMQNCPARLNGLLPGFTRAVTFYSGGTLLSATCAPMNIARK